MIFAVLCDLVEHAQIPCSRFTRQLQSFRTLRHPLNLRHVVVVNGLLTAVIPFDGYARPILFSDGALIGSIVLPANTIADVKLSGLFAGHFHH
jgi:hypothetical protein